MSEKEFKQVCQCKNCGNEAEMVVTCSLKEEQINGVPAHWFSRARARPKAVAFAAIAATKPIFGLIYKIIPSAKGG